MRDYHPKFGDDQHFYSWITNLYHQNWHFALYAYIRWQQLKVEPAVDSSPGALAATKGHPVSTSCRPGGHSSSMNTVRHFSRSFSTP